MGLLSLLARLNLDKSGFDAGLKQAEHQVSHFGAHLKQHLAAAFSVAAIEQLLHHTIEYGHEIHKLAETLSLSADEAGRWGMAAKLAGEDSGMLLAKFERLSATMRKALRGDEGAASALQDLGISMQELASMTPNDVLSRMADGIEETGFSADKAAAFFEIFGKNSSAVFRIMQEFKETKGHSFMDQAQIDNLERARKAIVEIKEEMEVLSGKALGNLRSGLGAFFALFKEFTLGKKGAMDEWWKKHGNEIIPGSVPGPNDEDKSRAASRNFMQQLAEEGERKDWIDQMDALVKVQTELNTLLDKQLPLEQQLNKLHEERKKLIAEAAAKGDEGGDIAIAQRQLAIAKIDDHIRTMAPQVDHITSRALPPETFHSNNLGRIGAYTGSGVGRTTERVDRIAKLLDGLKTSLETRGIKIKEL